MAVTIESCFFPNSIARSKASLCGLPVPTLRILLTPAARARSMTSSRSASNSGPSICACESMNIMSGLLQTRTIRHVFRKRSDHGPTFFSKRSGDNHSLRFKSSQLSRLQVRHDDHLATDQLFWFVVLRNSREHLPWFFFSNIDFQQQQLVCFRHTLR